jgi:hypothetical protein
VEQKKEVCDYFLEIEDAYQAEWGKGKSDVVGKRPVYAVLTLICYEPLR